MQADKSGPPILPAEVAHALRTPLGALVSALDVAGLPGVDGETREDALAIARRQAMKLAELIDRFDRPDRQDHATPA